jgi:hypothetical protein
MARRNRIRQNQKYRIWALKLINLGAIKLTLPDLLS